MKPGKHGVSKALRLDRSAEARDVECYGVESENIYMANMTSFLQGKMSRTCKIVRSNQLLWREGPRIMSEPAQDTLPPLCKL